MRSQPYKLKIFTTFLIILITCFMIPTCHMQKNYERANKKNQFKIPAFGSIFRMRRRVPNSFFSNFYCSFCLVINLKV